MLCWRAQPWVLSGRRCGLRWGRRWDGQLSVVRRLSQLTSSSRPCWETRSFWGDRAPAVDGVVQQYLAAHRCGGGGRRCRRRLRWVVRLAIQPMWRARRATSAAVQPRCCCAIAATNRGYRTRCPVPALPGVPDGGSPRCATAPAPLAPSPPAMLPRPAIGPGPTPTADDVCAGQHVAASMLLCDGCDQRLYVQCIGIRRQCP
jgi:hypothetical protein